jgi:DNA-binding transcriptional LysR family regulator
MMTTTPDLLASFVVLADELHYSRAASRLHVEQPALTKRIQQLERRLGVPVFLRTRRSVRLTAAGELLVTRARQVLSAVEAFEATARQLRDGEVGRLRIGFSPSAPHHVLPKLMRSFRRRHPTIECVLTELPSDVQITQLVDGEIDVGILRPSSPMPPQLVCTTFLEEPFVAVLPGDHPLATRRSVLLSELQDEAFVLVSRRLVAAVHDQTLAACADAGFTPRFIREATHIHAVVSLVAAGCGVAVLPESAAHLGFKDVVCKPLRKSRIVTRMAVAHLKSNPAAAARALAAEASRRFE